MCVCGLAMSSYPSVLIISCNPDQTDKTHQERNFKTGHRSKLRALRTLA